MSKSAEPILIDDVPSLWLDRPVPLRRPSLVLFRESDPHATHLLESLIERTVREHMEIDCSTEILEAGTKPITDDHFPGALPVQMPVGEAAIVQFGGTWVLYVMSSATAADLPGEGNAATQLLSNVVLALKPDPVYVFAADRFVRSDVYGPTVFKALRKANVEKVYVGSQLFAPRMPGARETWRSWTNSSANSHQHSMVKIASGVSSAVRRGRWPFAPHATPIGFGVGPSKELVVDPDEQAFIVAALPHLREGVVFADVVQALADRDLAPRRRWTSTHRKIRGELIPNGKGSHQTQLEQRLQRLIALLPDLAMGKHVQDFTQAQSYDTSHPGARTVVVENMPDRHRMAMDVPDLFQDVPESELREAVTFAIRHKLRYNHDPSEWAVELDARKDLRRRLASGEEMGVVDQLWAGPGGALIDTMAPGENLRQWVLDAIRDLKGAVAPLPAPVRSGEQKILAGFDGWVDDATGDELRILTTLELYQVRRRDRAADLSAAGSLRRAWHPRRGGRVGELVARMRPQVLHSAIANAVVDAIDDDLDGIAPLLRVGRGIVHAVDSAHVAHAVSWQDRGAQLERQVRHRERDLAAAADHARSMRVEVVHDTTTDSLTQEHRDRREKIHALKVEEAEHVVDVAGDALLTAKDELAHHLDFPDHGNPVPTPTWTDATVVAKGLAQLATSATAPKDVRLAIRRIIKSLKFTTFTDTHATGEVVIAFPDETEQREVLLGPITFTTPIIEPPESTRRAEIKARLAFAAQPPTPVTGASVEPDPALSITAATQPTSPRATRKSSTPQGKASRTDRTSGPDTDNTRPPSGPEPDSLTAPRPTPLSSLATTKGQYQRIRRALDSAGVHPHVGAAMLRCPFDHVRQVVYAAATKQPAPQTGNDPAYDALVVDTYLHGDPARAATYARQTSLPQRGVDAVKAAGRPITLEELQTALGRNSGRRHALLTATTQPSKFAPVAHHLPPLIIIGKELGANLSPLLTLRPCPHCAVTHGGELDIVAQVREVPSGLICSTCLKSADPDSPVYPHVYRELPHLLATAKAPPPTLPAVQDDASTTDPAHAPTSPSPVDDFANASAPTETEPTTPSEDRPSHHWTDVTDGGPPIDVTGGTSRAHIIARHVLLVGRNLPGLNHPKNDRPYKAIMEPTVKYLERQGMTHHAAMVLFDHPLDDAKRIIWHHLHPGTAPTDTDARTSHDPQFVSSVLTGYLTGPDPPRGPFNPANDRLQPAVNILHETGGTLTVGQLRGALGLPTAATTKIVNALMAPGGGFQPAVTVHQRATKYLTSDSRLHLVRCLHCGSTISMIVWIPEIPEGLLCGNCLKAPSPASPVYPEEYRALAAAPAIEAGITGPRARDRKQVCVLIKSDRKPIGTREQTASFSI